MTLFFNLLQAVILWKQNERCLDSYIYYRNNNVIDKSKVVTLSAFSLASLARANLASFSLSFSMLSCARLN